MQKQSLIIRDGILFIALLLMINHVWTQSSTGSTPAKKATSIHNPDREDKRVLRHIAKLQREIDTQLPIESDMEQWELLEALHDELTDIAQDYTHLSPGTAPLGPISSIFLVFKQRELRKRIAEIEKLIHEVTCS